jgi:ribosomal-protein-alanine N-acetyltransferase
MNGNPFPEIITDRLLLRKIEETDSAVILYLRSDASINQFIERPEHSKTKTITQALAHIKKLQTEMENNKSVAWGITLHKEPKIIGTICLWNISEDRKTAEVGYDLNPAFQKKGMMSEALQSVLQYGFGELDLEKVEAFTHIDNENSKKLLEHNGFQLIEDRKDEDNFSNVIFEKSKSRLNDF